MLVELVLASVLAITIALYLLNLTYQFKNKNDDIYQSLTYSSDKIAITKNIMNDLEDKYVISFINKQQEDQNTQEIDMVLLSKDANILNYHYRKLLITKGVKNTTITYGKTGADYKDYDVSDVSYYKKSIEKTLLVKTAKITISNQILLLNIPIKSMYDENNYDLKLFLKTNNNKLSLDVNGGNKWNSSTCTNQFILSNEECFKIIDNNTYGELPTPKRDGYKFIGWYSQASGGSKIENSTTFSKKEDITIYAHWEKDYLNTKDVGSYVSYSGNNGCSGTACEGKNGSNIKAKHQGWRIAYKKDNTIYLIPANGVESTAKEQFPTIIQKTISPMIFDQSSNYIRKYYFAENYEFDNDTGLFKLINPTDEEILVTSSNYQELIDKKPYFCYSYSVSWDPREKCGAILKISDYKYYETKNDFFADLVASEKIINDDATPTQEKTINLFNQLSKKYCNKKYAYNGECTNNTIWAMNTNDVFEITGKKLYIKSESDYSCIGDKTCIDNLEIINTSTDYWLATALESNIEDKTNSSYENNTLHSWNANSQYFTAPRISLVGNCFGGRSSCQEFLRPIIKLNPQIYVLSGSGTETDPYKITID